MVPPPTKVALVAGASCEALRLASVGEAMSEHLSNLFKLGTGSHRRAGLVEVPELGPSYTGAYEHLGSAAAIGEAQSPLIIANAKLEMGTAAARLRGAALSLHATPLRESKHVIVPSFVHVLTVGAVIKLLAILSNVLSQAAPLPEFAPEWAKKHVKHPGRKTSSWWRAAERVFGSVDAGEDQTHEKCEGPAAPTPRGHPNSFAPPPAPYFAIAYNSTQWVFYGCYAELVTHTQGFLVLVEANMLGVFLGVFYTYTMLTCATRETKQSVRNLIMGGVLLLSSQLFLICMLPSQTMLLTTGCVAAGCSILVGLAPLASIVEVIKSQDASSIPKPLALASLISSVLWLTCGLMLMDMWILVPNCVGTLSGLVSVSLVFLYPGSTVVGKTCAEPTQVRQDDYAPHSARSMESDQSDREDAMSQAESRVGGTGES